MSAFFLVLSECCNIGMVLFSLAVLRMLCSDRGYQVRTSKMCLAYQWQDEKLFSFS